MVKSINSGLKSSIKSLFQFLGKSILFLYNQIHLLFKTFLKYKFISLALIILPTLLAFLIKTNTHSVYTDDLVIKTNTKELNYQLYKNINEYNLLIKNKKIDILNSKLKIDTSILNKILSFNIEAKISLIEENEIISNIISSRDTNIKEEIKLEEIKLNINNELYSEQIITIKSKDQIDFTMFQKAILNHIENSSNVLQYQQIQLNVLSEKINNNNSFIKDLDTLIKIYQKEILSLNNLKNSKSTSAKGIDPMSMLLFSNIEQNNTNNQNPLELIEKRNKLIAQNSTLKNRLEEITQNYYIVVISSFSSLGQLDKNHIINKLPSKVLKWSLLVLIFGLLLTSIQNQLKKFL